MEELKLIDQYVKGVGDSELEYKRVIADLSQSETLNSLIKTICQDPAKLLLIASRSYEHWNGFFKIILYNSQALKLRLHIWPLTNGNQTTLENIHFHRWPFVSKILLGGYTNYEYIISEQGEIMRKYKYTPRAGAGSYELKEAGFEKLKLKNTTTHKQNDFLITVPMQLHRVIPFHSEYTASLMIQGPDKLDYSMVYNENEVVQKIDSPPLNADHTASILSYFLERFNNEFYAK